MRAASRVVGPLQIGNAFRIIVNSHDSWHWLAITGKRTWHTDLYSSQAGSLERSGLKYVSAGCCTEGPHAKQASRYESDSQNRAK